MFASVLDFIAKTNLFNFIIFAGVFALIFKVINIGNLLEKAKGDVVSKIDDSEKVKSEAESELKTLEEKISNLEEEVDELIKKSEENANTAGKKIIDDATKTVDNVKASAEKLKENKIALLKSDIIRRASVAAVETAKQHIINELESNKNLHDKFIDESVEAINESKYI